MATRIVINDLSVAKFVATNPVLQAAIRTAAERLEADAVANAPFGHSITWGPIKNKKGKVVFSHHHGYYREHFHVRPYRGGFRVWNDDPFAHIIEWGSIFSPAYAPIRRAVRQSGLRYRPNPKSRGA